MEVPHIPEHRGFNAIRWLRATALLWFNTASYMLMPIDDEYYYGVKAHAFIKRKDYPKAFECLEKALHVKDSSIARGQIAWCYYATGDFEKSLENYRISYRLNRRAKVALSLVSAALKCKQIDEARIVLTEIRNSYDSLDREDRKGFADLEAYATGELLSHVQCPRCAKQPHDHDRWLCSCGMSWNTFSTRGCCPGCNLQWLETACPVCHELSPHTDWYISSQPRVSPTAR
jgi:tetratricopeptide (TPR) repeat protein